MYETAARMNWWKFAERVGLILVLVLGIAIIAMNYFPQLERERKLHDRVQALESEIRSMEDRLAELKRNQLKLETDPRFIEKVAREELGYARPGETVFRFVVEE